MTRNYKLEFFIGIAIILFILSGYSLGIKHRDVSAGYQTPTPVITTQEPTNTHLPDTSTPKPTERREKERPTKTPTITPTFWVSGDTYQVCDPCSALQTIAAAQATIAGSVK